MIQSKPVIYVSAAVLVSALMAYGYHQSTKTVEQETVKTEAAKPTADVVQQPAIDNTLSVSQPAQQEQAPQKTLEAEVAEEEARLKAVDEQEILADERLLASVDTQIATTVEQPMLWEALDENADVSEVKISDEIQGAQKIKVNRELLNNVVPGDKIQIPVLDGGEYTVNIESVDDNKSNVNIRGHIEVAGSSYLATITQGEKRTFATLSTPNGTYDLRLVNGRGWVYDGDQLNAHIDTTKPDTLLPPSNLLPPKT